MATEFSFDVVSRVDMAEVVNAVHQATREIQTRYDFRKGTASITLDQKEAQIVLQAAHDMELHSLKDILETKLAKRGVSIRALEYGPPTPAGGDTLRQVVTLKQGIPEDKAKAMTKLIRDSKIKVRAQIQSDEIRVFGSKKDDLQAAIALLKEQDFGFDLQFINYR